MDNLIAKITATARIAVETETAQSTAPINTVQPTTKSKISSFNVLMDTALREPCSGKLTRASSLGTFPAPMEASAAFSASRTTAQQPAPTITVMQAIRKETTNSLVLEDTAYGLKKILLKENYCVKTMEPVHIFAITDFVHLTALLAIVQHIKR